MVVFMGLGVLKQYTQNQPPMHTPMTSTQYSFVRLEDTNMLSIQVTGNKCPVVLSFEFLSVQNPSSFYLIPSEHIDFFMNVEKASQVHQLTKVTNGESVSMGQFWSIQFDSLGASLFRFHTPPHQSQLYTMHVTVVYLDAKEDKFRLLNMCELEILGIQYGVVPQESSDGCTPANSIYCQGYQLNAMGGEVSCLKSKQQIVSCSNEISIPEFICNTGIELIQTPTEADIYGITIPKHHFEEIFAMFADPPKLNSLNMSSVSSVNESLNILKSYSEKTYRGVCQEVAGIPYFTPKHAKENIKYLKQAVGFPGAAKNKQSYLQCNKGIPKNIPKLPRSNPNRRDSSECTESKQSSYSLYWCTTHRSEEDLDYITLHYDWPEQDASCPGFCDLLLYAGEIQPSDSWEHFLSIQKSSSNKLSKSPVKSSYTSAKFYTPWQQKIYFQAGCDCKQAFARKALCSGIISPMTVSSSYSVKFAKSSKWVPFYP